MILPFVHEDLAPVWQKVESEIRTRYYARDARHDEMERLLAKTAPLAKAAPSHRAFEDVVNAMIAEFGDSHFEFLSDEDPGYYLMDGLALHDKAATMPQVGAWFRRAPNAVDGSGYTVQMVLEGGAAERAGLRVGDLITRVDGRPFSPVAGLSGSIGNTVALTVLRDGKPQEANVDVTRTTALRMFLDATLASRRTVVRDGRRIVVLHLWTQAGGEFTQALEDALALAKTADGFVLDLRGGFGGEPVSYARALKAYAGPLVVVVDHGSRSAKEVLSFELQKAGRAEIVGERTAGAVLGTMPDRLNAWSYLEIPIGEYPVAGIRLERCGVEPDVPVSSDKDPVERAVELLTAKRV